MTQRRVPEPEIFRITGARRSHTDDLNRRINRYLFSMAIRTACVALIFVAHGPMRWVVAAGAIFLPYVAVILANASDRRRGAAVPLVDHRGLAAGSAAAESSVPWSAAEPGAGVVLEGRVVDTPAPATNHRVDAHARHNME